MDEDVKIILKNVSKRIEKISAEQLNKSGFNTKTSRLKFLSELVIEQIQNVEVKKK